MSLSIYSKYKMDSWRYFIESDVSISDDNKTQSDSSANLYFNEHLYADAIHTTYSDWNLAHNILFNCSSEDHRQTFFRDDFGFIPPHVLNKIVQSNSFQNLKRDLEYECDCYEQIGSLNVEYEEILKTLQILDYILKKVDEGIVYS